MHRTPRARATQIAAVIVALLTVRLVAGDLSALHRGARVFGATRPVVVARADLDLGTRVRRGDLRVMKLPAAAVPTGALARLDDAVDRVVAVPVLAGASVSERALAPRRRDGLAGIVSPGRRAVRVTTADGLRPDAGSVVDIIATLDSREVGGTLEPSVVVAVSAPHRGEAFAGAREIIDRAKSEAPIWKKEVEGGEERWVEGEPPASGH